MEPRPIIPKEKFTEAMLGEVAQKTGMPMGVVEDVLSFTFGEVKKAFKQHRHIEISGFGHFKVVPRRLMAEQTKALGFVDYFERELQKDHNEVKKRKINIMLQAARERMEFLKSMQPDEYPYDFS